MTESRIHKNKNSLNLRRKNFWGYVFIAPSLIGLFLFFIGPMLFSLGMSFTKWDLISSPEFVGITNYVEMVKDPLVSKALLVTGYFALLVVPLGTVITLLAAVLLNSKVKHLSVFRTIFYIPSIVPAIASSAIWMFLCNPLYGLFNNVLDIFGLPAQGWIYDTKLVIPTLAAMQIWASGNMVIIYLAGLQSIPNQLYEAIEIDGGKKIHKFMHITVPLLSPIIFYNMVMSIITSVQTFTQAYVMTNGGPDNASLFYMLLLYRTAFTNQEMGYASALAWILFIAIGLLTLINFKASKSWVFYQGDNL